MTSFIQGPAGRLEALIDDPAHSCHVAPVSREPVGEASVGAPPDERPRVAVVLAHPLPGGGGTMHSKVVYQMGKGFCRTGAAVLRFNFRGVGTSEGVHDHGQGEQADVRAALDEMERRFPGRPLVLAGFSFGAAMALYATAADPRVRAVAALGYPFRVMGDPAVLAGLRVPRLFVQGEDDEFGGGERIAALVQPLPEPKRLVIVPGADHFFTAKLDAVHAAVADWAAGRPWETP